MAQDQQSLSRFMHHVGCNISKEIGGRIRQWRGNFWERRYDAIVVTDEPGEPWKRLKYVMRGEIPTVELPVRTWESADPARGSPRSRGQPP